MPTFCIDEAGGRRVCRSCGGNINKGNAFLLEQLQGGMYQQYNNHCPTCGIKVLKQHIKQNVSVLNALVKLTKWDQ